MLPDLHTGFSRGRSGGLVFPSLSEFSTVSCDPHSQGFGIVNKAEIDVFLELCCFFDDPIAVAGRNNNSLRYADDTTLMAESEEELKSLWMKVKVESEKVGLKLNIKKMKIMASGPITSWEIDGETVETVLDFIFWASKVTADGDCSHDIKRRLLLGRKVMTNLDSIFKSRDITLPTKVHLVKAMVFPVVMYGCENWTVKKAEH